MLVSSFGVAAFNWHDARVTGSLILLSRSFQLAQHMGTNEVSPLWVATFNWHDTGVTIKSWFCRCSKSAFSRRRSCRPPSLAMGQARLLEQFAWRLMSRMLLVLLQHGGLRQFEHLLGPPHFWSRQACQCFLLCLAYNLLRLTRMFSWLWNSASLYLWPVFAFLNPLPMSQYHHHPSFRCLDLQHLAEQPSQRLRGVSERPPTVRQFPSWRPPLPLWSTRALSRETLPRHRRGCGIGFWAG